MKEENEVLLKVEPQGRVRTMPLSAKRARLERLLGDLRKLLDDAVEDEDMHPEDAEAVWECMNGEPEYRVAWGEILQDWKEEAWDWPCRVEFAREMKDLLENVESAFWSVRHAEMAEMNV
jgi:hypothetical protein